MSSAGQRVQFAWLGAHETAERGAIQTPKLPGTESPAVALASRFFERPRKGIAKKVLMGTVGVMTRMKRAWDFSVAVISSLVLYEPGSRFLENCTSLSVATCASVIPKVLLLKLYLLALSVSIARETADGILSGVLSLSAEAPASAAASAAFCNSVLVR